MITRSRTAVAKATEELAKNTNCDLPASSTRFIFRLLSNEMAQRFPVHSDIYGFALLSLNGGFGVTATVFADRAREIAARGEARVSFSVISLHTS
jgi:hypothetical protein